MSVTFSTVQELPVIQEEVPLRADAARNRDKVLAAAERLFREHGPTCVTMDAVAAEAGVGKERCSAASATAPGSSSRC